MLVTVLAAAGAGLWIEPHRTGASLTQERAGGSAGKLNPALFSLFPTIFTSVLHHDFNLELQWTIHIEVRLPRWSARRHGARHGGEGEQIPNSRDGVT